MTVPFVLPSTGSPPPYSPLLALPDAVLAQLSDLLDGTTTHALACTCTHMHALLSPPPTPPDSPGPYGVAPPTYDARMRLLFWGSHWSDGVPEIEDVTNKFDLAGRFDRVAADDVLELVPSPALGGMRFRYRADSGFASWGDDPWGHKARKLNTPIHLHIPPSGVDVAKRWHDIVLDKNGRVWEKGLEDGISWNCHTARELQNVVHVFGTKSRAAVTSTGRIVAWRANSFDEPVSMLPRLPPRSLATPSRSWIDFYPPTDKEDGLEDRTLKIVVGRAFVVILRDNGEIWLANRQTAHQWSWHSVARVKSPRDVEIVASDHGCGIYYTGTDMPSPSPSSPSKPKPSAYVITADRSTDSTAWSISPLDTPPIAQMALHDAGGYNYGVARTCDEVYVWRAARSQGSVTAKKMYLPCTTPGRRLMPVDVSASALIAVEVEDHSKRDIVVPPPRTKLRRFFSTGAVAKAKEMARKGSL